MVVDRTIAVLTGGPLDGTFVSVADPNVPITGIQDMGEDDSYQPGEEVELSDELLGNFLNPVHKAQIVGARVFDYQEA